MVEVGEALRMDTEVLMMVTLPSVTERIPVSGKVIWITPPHNRHTTTPIIGIQFIEDRSGLFLKISNLLLGAGARDPRTVLGF